MVAGLFVPAGRAAARQLNVFKHALVQDAAYGALLRKPRRALARADCRDPGTRVR